MDKRKLDEILERHKAQPVGHGYIDIIVKHDTYKPFITDLIQNSYKIKSISWWEWCPGEKGNGYGFGGPKSRYYEGWFSELATDIDDIEFPMGMKSENQIEVLTTRIEAKSISFPGDTVTFAQHDWLTPAIWLDVPDDWRNAFDTKQKR